MKQLIHFFATKHLFSNLIFIVVLAGGLIFWQLTNKEELPDMALDMVRVSIMYPGASAEEIDYSITWPVENELKSVSGIDTIKSTSSEGGCVIMIELIRDKANRVSAVTDIRNAVDNVKLPIDVLDRPDVREFKTSHKPICDIALYIENEHFLNDKTRRVLQTYAHTLENRLLSSAKVNSITKKGYYKEEFRIELNPHRLIEYRIPVSTVSTEISNSSARIPAGNLQNRDEDRVTVYGEINKYEDFLNLPIQGTFDGEIVRLRHLANVKDTFEKNKSIIKINGYEGVIFKVRKNTNHGIIDTIDFIKKELESFSKLTGTSGVRAVLLDDESLEVRNRISMIGSNGIIGFVLILSILFIFLNFRSGFWVAMGIPFTFGVTMIMANLTGFTINNTTLAAVILIMGMVVDDAIVVSENIIRLRHKGLSPVEAAVEGTSYVLLPITASILTTIVVFIPLLFFEGRIAIMGSPIPGIVTFMLVASLVESVIILPAHMTLVIPRWIRIVFSLGTVLLIEKYRKSHTDNDEAISEDMKEHWFEKVETRFAGFMAKALKYRYVIIVFFIFFTVIAGLIYTNKMKFVLFPREEATDINVIAEAPPGTTLKNTAILSQHLENIFTPYLGKEVTGFQTLIGEARRTRARENQLYMKVELVSADKRKKSLSELEKEWGKKLKQVKGFDKARFSKQRFGMESGSALEIVVQENDNAKRSQIAYELMKELEKLKGLTNVEVNEPPKNIEYQLVPNRDIIKRLNLQANEAGTTMRIALEGRVLYEIINGDEEKNVRLTFHDNDKRNINDILKVPVKNKEGYMVPLGTIVTAEKISSASEIARLNNQRTVMVYADLRNTKGRSPLELAEYCEAHIFPGLVKKYPSAIFSFEGEVKMTRESTLFFPLAVASALFLIYVILALQFNSLQRPLIVMIAIPPALAGVVYTYLMHGMSVYGFFGIIGFIGLSGIIVNDAIVLLTSLDKRLDTELPGRPLVEKIAVITASRLRAVLLTTLTTAAGMFPSAYGIMGYDSMLSEMMLSIAWGLIFGTTITLLLIPSVYMITKEVSMRLLPAKE